MMKIKYFTIIFMIIFAILGENVMGEQKNILEQLVSFLPQKIDGWEISEKDQVFDQHTLFDYIDGGAELYLSYGFTSVVNRTFSRKNQPDIVVDIFDMQTSQDAFGVFTYSRETIDSTFGQGSQSTEGSILFWKDHFYISILASPETHESKQAIIHLASKIDKAIPSTGQLPAVLNLLPANGLLPETVKYFHHYIWLNTFYYISGENILHIDKNTDAVLSKYQHQDKKVILLIVKYHNERDTKKAFQDFLNNYIRISTEKSVVEMKKGQWTAFDSVNDFIVAVFNAPNEQEALNLVNATLVKLK